MESMLRATKNEVQGRLRILGLTMKDFAEKIQEEPNTVRKAITRYCGTGKRPTGKKTKAILGKLQEEFASSSREAGENIQSRAQAAAS